MRVQRRPAWRRGEASYGGVHCVTHLGLTQTILLLASTALAVVAVRPSTQLISRIALEFPHRALQL